MKKIFFLVLISLVLLFYYSSSKAQVQLTNDTLRIGGGSEAKNVIYVNKGMTRVPVTVYLKNAFDIAGFRLRVVFDTTVMSPYYPSVPESSFSQLTRSLALPLFVKGLYGDPWEIFFTGSATWDPFTENIDAGRGPIVEFYFNIKSNALQGCRPIKLEDDTLPGIDNYIVDIYATDEYIPVLVNGTICVSDTITTINHPPVISSVGPQSVVVGETLTFSVSASDQDNDQITLFAQNLPSNSSFPQVQGIGSVTGDFTFIPTAVQAPGTFFVNFIARDDSLAADTITVTIFLYEEVVPPQEPTDKLKILSTEGGVPGSTGKLVPLYLSNEEDTVYGVEFTLSYNHQAIIIDSILPASRIEGFSIYSNRGDSLGKLTVLLFGLGNEMIFPGSDTILYLAMSVDTLAPFGNTALDLISGWEAISIDPTDSSRALALTDGFFAVDRFGDVNLDRRINVADVVNLVAYILGNISLDTRHWDAADVNRDGGVNVGDLVGVINTILGRAINAPIGTLREPLAYLHLEYDSLQAGSEGKIDLWADLKTSVAGVQLKIKYDPEQLTFSTPALTSRSNSFDTLFYKDDGKGNLTVVFFRFGKAPIAPGEGSILSLPVTVNPGFDREKLQLYLKEAILADPDAVVIPVEKGEVILPKSFSLSQNYPNPFNPNTTIRFEIGVDGGNQAAVNTTLKVYNILGQIVKTLINEPKLPGIYYLTWDGKNEQGEKVSSGLYFYQLRSGNYSETKKMVLLK